MVSIRTPGRMMRSHTANIFYSFKICLIWENIDITLTDPLFRVSIWRLLSPTNCRPLHYKKEEAI